VQWLRICFSVVKEKRGQDSWSSRGPRFGPGRGCHLTGCYAEAEVGEDTVFPLEQFSKWGCLWVIWDMGRKYWNFHYSFKIRFLILCVCELFIIYIIVQ
jgi:hypothetical protein